MTRPPSKVQRLTFEVRGRWVRVAGFASGPRPPAPGPRRGVLDSLLLGALLLVGAAPADQEEMVRDIAGHLRCPVCQNLSVGDSPSELANQMRGVIREQVAAGRTREQIEAYFVEKYGEWVLLAPKKRGFNLVAWLLPFVGVAAGGVAVGVIARRWAAAREAKGGEVPLPPKPEDEPYRERLRRELDEFVR